MESKDIRKVFISQPMSGRSVEEIKKERDLIIKKIKDKFPEYFYTIEVINSFFENTFTKSSDHLNADEERKLIIKNLARSIELLSEADVAYFVKGFDTARGCQIEYAIAKDYHIPVVFSEYEVENNPEIIHINSRITKQMSLLSSKSISVNLTSWDEDLEGHKISKK